MLVEKRTLPSFVLWEGADEEVSKLVDVDGLSYGICGRELQCMSTRTRKSAISVR